MSFEAMKDSNGRRDVMEFVMNKRPKCPHCGADFDIDKNEAWHLYSDDETNNEVECDSCEKSFSVTVHCQYSFSTDEQEDMDEDETAAIKAIERGK